MEILEALKDPKNSLTIKNAENGNFLYFYKALKAFVIVNRFDDEIYVGTDEESAVKYLLSE